MTSRFLSPLVVRPIALASMALVVLVGCRKENAEYGAIQDDKTLSGMVVRAVEDGPQEPPAARTPTGLFIVDSVVGLDSVGGLQGSDSARVGDELFVRFAQSVASEKMSTEIAYDTNQCNGEVLSVAVFADGMQVAKSDSMLDQALLRGASLSRIGLSDQDSLGSMASKLGVPAKIGDDYAVFATVPANGMEDYCDAGWKLVAKFRDGKLELARITYCFEDC